MKAMSKLLVFIYLQYLLIKTKSTCMAEFDILNNFTSFVIRV